MNRFTPVDEKEFERDYDEEFDTEKQTGDTTTQV